MAIDTFLFSQFVIPNTNGIPSDAAINTWSHGYDAGLVSESDALDIIVDDLTAFYDDWHLRMNGLADLDQAYIKIYARADAEPRVPVRIANGLGLPSVSGAPLPNEVALCMSFSADVGSGDIAARMRGRVYLPFIKSAEVTTGGGAGIPSNDLLTDVQTAGANLLAGNTSHPNVKWTVHSQVTGFDFEVTHGWVDNAFDTQRRRGPDPTARSTF